MREVVRNTAHLFHQRSDTVQHGVEIAGQFIEVVARPIHRYTPGEIAGHNLAAGLIDLFNAPHQAAAHHRATDQAQNQRDCQSPEQCSDNQLVRSLQFVQIAADQQAKAAAQLKCACPRPVDFSRRPAFAFEAKVQPAILRRTSGWPATDIACQRTQVLIR